MAAVNNRTGEGWMGTVNVTMFDPTKEFLVKILAGGEKACRCAIRPTRSGARGRAGSPAAARTDLLRAGHPVLGRPPAGNGEHSEPAGDRGCVVMPGIVATANPTTVLPAGLTHAFPAAAVHGLAGTARFLPGAPRSGRGVLLPPAACRA